MRTTSNTNIILDKLRQNPILADMSTEELRAVADFTEYREYPKGSPIKTTDDRDARMYLLVSGRVKLSVMSPEGKELALSYLEAPAYFGEMGSVEVSRRYADVTATTDAEVLGIRQDGLTLLFGMKPELAIEIVSALTQRLLELTSRLEGMAFHDATQRVMRVLLNVATASYEARGVPVIEGLTHHEIATLAGTSRETASRVISNLCRGGTAATKGRKIVLDLFALRDEVERNQ
ncbi:MAG: Crp/Fnr family transcriptional regulator [Coriobacteriia bacterium]|nr:Crp/Fnr family transcriptional regulator [Coriobacteriia bacterium]